MLDVYTACCDTTNRSARATNVFQAVPVEQNDDKRVKKTNYLNQN